AAPAYVATHQGRDKCLKLLIDTKADINRPDKNGATLAWVAAQQGQDKCLKLLIDVKVDINKPNKDGQTLAWIAAQSGQDKCLQLLIDTKADINKPNKDGQTPTWIATQQGQDKCLKLLIDAKVDINKPNKDGQTLAWIATQSGQDKCLQLLIDAKADINKPNKDGIIPAYVAAQNGQDKCLELLIAAKADLSQLDQTLNDPKFLKNYEVITALVHDDPNLLNSTLTKEADFNKNIVIGNNQYSLIQYGIKKMSYRCLPILIEKIMGKATVSHFMPMIQAFQSFSLVIPNADRIIALSKKLQEIDEKQLKRIDDKEEISLVRDTLEPIRKTYSLPNYLLPVYFECPVTSSFLLEKLKAPFKENSKEWKTLISVAKQTYSMKEFPYQIQKYLLQMKQNEAQFEKMLTKFQNGNSKLQKQHELEKRRLFLRSIESASIEFPFLNAKRNLRRNIQNIPLNERDFLTTLAQKLKFPHQLLQPGSFLASLFYNIYPKSREFTTLNALITEIEVFLRNQNYQPVHRDLASIKDHYQNFIKDVCAAKTEQEKTNLTSPKLPIIYRASAYPRLLNAEAQRLLLVKKEKNNTQYGTHFVQSYNGIHWKQDPHAPGVEYMVHSLNTLIKSSLSPITELVKIKQGQSCFIYQTSQTIEGESLDFILRSNPRLIDKIDPHNFSSMCTLGLIIDPQDAKPDNYMAKLIVNTKKEVVSCSLVGIDNDIAFVNPIIENSNKSHSIDVKNVLYFFPQMKSPIDPTFKKAFCNLCPEITVIKWLKSLYKKNEKYEELYKQSIFTRQELKNLKLPIRLVPNFAQNLTQKLHLIKKTMLNKKDLTHNELFAKTHPILYKYYRDVKIKHKNPLEATKSLYRRSAETVEEKLSLTTKITSRSKLQTAIAMEKAKKWDFEDHRKEEIKTALENFIKEVNFKTLTTEEQQQLFFELADCPQIEHLTIRSSNAFDKNIIEHLRNRLPNLKSLTLDRCDYVTQEDLLHFVTSPSLQRIQLVLGKNRLLKRNQWNFLTDRFENFHLQIPKTKKLIPVNKVDPNLLLQQMIISCPEEKEMLLFALEQRDVDPNALAPENSPLKGKNALHLAASYNLLELLKLLVDHGGDITVKDYSGKTPLDRALAQDKNGSHQEMIDYLIKEVEQYRSVEIQKEISQKSVEEFYFV
ncbi:MAG: ankyrin repeat domain-containing protein, partial [Chlamydiota bacterium]